MSIFSFGSDNEKSRQIWLSKVLREIPAGLKILDAGAGELANKIFCNHLDYKSQDFCQYKGKGNGVGLQMQNWDTLKIDIVSDITEIPVPNESFDVILCSEVLEHVPDPVSVIKEFARILRPEGILIITAPFCSLTHFAPYYFVTGLSRYWYQYHLNKMDFEMIDIQANGDWYSFIAQEIRRLPKIGKKYGYTFIAWVALIVSLPLLSCIYMLKLSQNNKDSSELLCFGWHIRAKKNKFINN
jgi:ubiquinone/menaquinone biosynthesis C-methylase UbiE